MLLLVEPRSDRLDARPCPRNRTAGRGAALLRIGAESAFAQDPLEFNPAQSGARLGDWGLAVTPYGWFTAQCTDVGTTKLRQSFNDLASITNVGFRARVLARWRWLLFVSDWIYADLENEQQVGPIAVTEGIQQNIPALELGGRVYGIRPTPRRGVGLCVSAGARCRSGSWPLARV